MPHASTTIHGALPVTGHDISAFFPHFLTLTFLIYLLGPSAASITLILSVTLIIGCLILRPGPLPGSHSAAVIAAASADLRTPHEVRAYYWGYLKGHEDGQKEREKEVHAHAVVEGALDAAVFDDLRSEGMSTVRTNMTKKSRGICGPAVVWKDRPAFSASVGSGTPAG
jgi:hypothetical protein